MANRIVTAAVTGESIKLSEKSAGAAGSFNAVSLAFTFDSAWDDTTSKIVQFLNAYGANPVNITLTSGMLVSGAYIVPIPAEPLVYAGEMTITVRGVGFEIDGTTAERIIVCASTTMKVLNSLYEVGGTTPVEPTPTQAEQLLAAVSSVTGMTVTSETLASGSSATVTKTTNVDETVNLAFGLPTGSQGSAGRSIVSVVKTGTAGLVDTYTITFSDSTMQTFSISNGVDGVDGATGNGIASVTLISGTHAAGTTDTYRITFTDATTFDFGVYNGANGEGAGDMLASVYDPNAKNADAFSMANMVEGTTNKIFTATERTKLTGIATGATANGADATLLDRANHTGTQLKSTISDFSHVHGNITNDGKIGSTADLMVCTTTLGAVTTKTVADTKTLLGIADNTYVKLLSTTVGTAAASVSLDLSGIDVTQYSALKVFAGIKCTTSSTTVNVTFNGLTSDYQCKLSSTETETTNSVYIARFPVSFAYASEATLEFLYYPGTISNYWMVMAHTLSASAETLLDQLGSHVLSSGGITSIAFTPTANNIDIGSVFTVYGVKK